MACLHTHSSMTPQPKPPKPERSQCSQVRSVVGTSIQRLWLQNATQKDAPSNPVSILNTLQGKKLRSVSHLAACFTGNVAESARNFPPCYFVSPFHLFSPRFLNDIFLGNKVLQVQKEVWETRHRLNVLITRAFWALYALSIPTDPQAFMFWYIFWRIFTTKILPGASWRFGRWQWIPWVSLKLA